MTGVVLCTGVCRRYPFDSVVIDFGSRLIMRKAVVAHVRPATFALAAALIAASPQRLSMGELIDYLWGDRADGGPDDACVLVRQNIYLLRISLSAIGVCIVNDFGWGWRAVIK